MIMLVDIQTENYMDPFSDDGAVQENNLTPKSKEQVVWIRSLILIHKQCSHDCVACQVA